MSAEPLRADPERSEHHGLTGIYVFAVGKDGRAPHDIAELDEPSLSAWLARGDRTFVENVVRVMLGYGHAQKESKHDNA